jgi:hypothetical protein
MASQHRWVAKIVFELKKQGWDYRYGNKHVVLYPADKKFRCFTVAMTPSDRYAMKNAIRDIQKAGGKV